MRVLRFLLWLLPGEFRREYGEELLATVQDRWREAASTDRLGSLRFWLRQAVAIVRAGVALRCRRGILGGADTYRHRQENRTSAVWSDMRHSARALSARPGLTLAAVLTLGLGVGASTSMFSAVHSVLLRSLPYRAAGEIVVLRQVDARDGSLADGISAANLRDVAATAHTLSRAGLAHAHGFTLHEGGRAVSLRSWLVSDGFFDAIGAEVHLGRAFLPAEYAEGRDAVVLLSHRTWQARFGGDPGIVGRELILDDKAHTVVGVLEPDFKYPASSEVWAPRPPLPWDQDTRARSGMDGVARLAPGTNVAQAQAELDRIAENLAVAYPGANANLGLRAIPLRRHLFGDVESPLILLLGAVGLVLLTAAANVAGLQLARGAGRSREYALRGALGASSRRILRLAAVESLLLAGAGSLLGIALAYVGVGLIRILAPRHLPRIDELAIDGPVLIFGLVAAVASALAAGVAPAVRASRTDVHLALSEGSRGSTRGPRASRLRDRLVVAEIAIALMLSIGAGLLVRSFDRLLDNELGFDPHRRLAVQVFAHDDEHRPDLDFFRRSVEEIGALPGVEMVGLTTSLPLADDQSFWTRVATVGLTFDDRAAPIIGQEPTTRVIATDGNYAAALGIALRAGRTFSTRDRSSSPPVAMVNEAFVRRHSADRHPVGRRLTLHRSDSLSREIVGVLADVRPEGFESEARAEVYLPISQSPSGSLTFVIETHGPPAPIIAAVREAIWTVKPSQAIWAARPMTDLLSDWVRQRRFNTALLLVFAGLALCLAAIGVYGLMSTSVEQRIGELGVRRALGGQTRDILGMILRRGLALALTGTAVGLVGSVALSRLLRSMLFGIEPLDFPTFGVLSAVVVGVALLAALLPAHRATRIDPMVALRSE